jgi:hypothetical protein
MRDGDGAESPAVVGGLDACLGDSSMDLDRGSEDVAWVVEDAAIDPFGSALVRSDDSTTVC